MLSIIITFQLAATMPMYPPQEMFRDVEQPQYSEEYPSEEYSEDEYDALSSGFNILPLLVISGGFLGVNLLLFLLRK
jgi:hypothetical protein